MKEWAEVSMRIRSRLPNDLLEEVAFVCVNTAADIINDHLQEFPDNIDLHPVKVKVTTSKAIEPGASASPTKPTHDCGLGTIKVPFPTPGSLLQDDGSVNIEKAGAAAFRFIMTMVHEAAHVWDFRLHQAEDTNWEIKKTEYWGWRSSRKGRRVKHAERDCEAFAYDVESFFEGLLREDTELRRMAYRLREAAILLAAREKYREQGRDRRTRRVLPLGHVRFSGTQQAYMIYRALERLEYFYMDESNPGPYSHVDAPTYKKKVLKLSRWREVNHEFLYQLERETEDMEEDCRWYGGEACSRARAGRTIYERVSRELKKMEEMDALEGNPWGDKG